MVNSSLGNGHNSIHEMMVINQFGNDILIENFKPGTMEKWGIGNAVLAEKFPRLIHCRVSGFGADGPLGGGLALRADFDWPKADRRREFLRVRINADGALDLFANQSSGVLTSVVWGDGLVDTAAGRTIARGDMVPFIPLSGLMS